MQLFILLQLYLAFVRSVVDYGSMIYGCACATNLHTLGTVHRADIHLATGAFHTTRIECLLVDAGELLYPCVDTYFFAAIVLRYLVFQIIQHISPFFNPNIKLRMWIVHHFLYLQVPYICEYSCHRIIRAP